MHRLLLCLAAGLTATSASAAPVPVDVTSARASMVGKWIGQLEYLDYSANKWFGIPVATTIEDQGDGATTIRKSDFDDGPKTGMVRITTVELFDPATGTVTSGTFRKGRKADITIYTVRIAGTANNSTQWTMIEEMKGEDDNRAAMLRLTTVRIGDVVETLKEVDFLDDNKQEWVSRNRTRLTRAN